GEGEAGVGGRHLGDVGQRTRSVGGGFEGLDGAYGAALLGEPDRVGEYVVVGGKRGRRERVADVDRAVGDVERPAAAQRGRADQAARGGDMRAAGRYRHLDLEQRALEALADVAAVEQDVAARLQRLADRGELVLEHADVGQAQDGVA